MINNVIAYVPDDRLLEILANTFGCSKGTLPITYLGLPLSLTKPTVSDFYPLVSKCERWLVAFSSYLSEAGRLELTNALLITTNLCYVQFLVA